MERTKEIRSAQSIIDHIEETKRSEAERKSEEQWEAIAKAINQMYEQCKTNYIVPILYDELALSKDKEEELANKGWKIDSVNEKGHPDDKGPFVGLRVNFDATTE